MTSLYSSTHGCWNNFDPLDPSFTTLAEILRDRGYVTAAVPSHAFLARKYGLAQGFDHFDTELVPERIAESIDAITSKEVSEKAIAWMAKQLVRRDGRPWFLWLHYFDPLETLPVLGELRLLEGRYTDSLTRGRWKLIVDVSGKRIQLFDRQHDPGEQRDVSALHPEITRSLGAELAQLKASAREKGQRFGRASRLTFSEEDMGALRELGYME